MNRRHFLTLAASAGATLFLPYKAWPSMLPKFPKEEEGEPHFFLQIFLNGGADPTYLFDARPLAFTAAGKIQNYNGIEPSLFTDARGNSCYIAESAKALRPHMHQFSVLNGVVMTPTFDGHSQNLNFFLTGSPFGGDSFLPFLNSVSPLPLDGVQSGSFFADILNHGNVVPVDPATLSLLRDKLAAHTPIQQGSEMFQFLQGRLQANAQGQGRFSVGSRQMLAGFQNTESFREKLLGIGKPDPQLNPEEQFVSMLGSVFRNRVSRSAFWVFADTFDTHSEEQAKAQPKMFTATAEKIATIFYALANTPFDSQRSLLDVTTVLVNSEFSRTMRQEGQPIDATGTDHNQLNNSFLIGGKGVRCGLVLGASDFSSTEEVLSPAHKFLDSKTLKLMGRPFDFASHRPVQTLPSVYDPKLYLTSESVVNTIYSLFGVASSRYRTLDRAGMVAPVLTGLLA